MTPEEFGLTKPTYRSAEARALLSVGNTKFWELVKTGRLQPKKCGRLTLFLATDIAAFLNSLSHERGQ